MSDNLQDGEEPFWEYKQETGFFRRQKMKVCLTNYRLFAYDISNSKMIGLLLLQLLDDISVINTRRIHQSNWAGGGTYLRGFGLMGGRSVGESHTIGDILFLSKGEVIIRIQGIYDPTNLRKLALIIKKHYPKKELERFLSGIQDNNSSVVRDNSICLHCGIKNAKDASFCSKCGAVLR